MYIKDQGGGQVQTMYDNVHYESPVIPDHPPASKSNDWSSSSLDCHYQFQIV